MGRIQSGDDFEPEERDYFNDRYKNESQETHNFGDTYEVQRNLEEAIKDAKAVRFVEILSILIEKGIFQ